jgi:hypothetical protein
MSQVEIIARSVTVRLPDWFGHSSEDYSCAVKYPEGHVNAGQVERTVWHNGHVDALFEYFNGHRVLDLDEYCDGMDKTVRFDIESNVTDQDIIAAVENFLKTI